jgi:hypothetical protein
MAKLYLQLNEPGSGEISIPLDNPAAVDIAILKLIELNYRGERRGGFFVENIDKTNVDSSEGMGRWVQASGRGMLAILEEAIIWDWFTDDIELIRHFVAMPKAAMLWTLLDEAHNKQVNIYGAIMDRKCFPLLTWDFTMTHDSLGVPWTDSEDMEFKVGTSLLDVLRQIAALGIDFDIDRNWIDGTLRLHAYANGLGGDVSDDVHFRLGYNCTQVTDSEAGGEIRNAFMVNFPDPVYPWVVLTDVPSINKYRRRENFLQAFNASNAATAGAYGQAELDALKNAKHAISLKISDANGPRCFVDYKLGDWISYDDGSGTEVKYRIRGIQLEWADQWYADVVVELNDVLMETLLRTARDLRKIGSASSGSSLKTTPDIVANSISVTNAAIVVHNADLTAHGGSPLSTAINDFIVGSAIGTWIKKTLAETRTILGIPSGGFGDVVGPVGATINHVAFFDGATGKLIKDNGLGLTGSNTGDQTLPVKASGAELDTGTDDDKFATAKALKDSHNVPSVIPSTAGKVLTSDGTDWISSVPTGGIEEAPIDGTPYSRQDADWVPTVGEVEEAPINGLQYGREDGAWTEVLTENHLFIDQAGGTGDTYGILAGARDGNNVEFTVSQSAYASGSLSVYFNGQLLTQGSSEDWHEAIPASGTFHFTVAPEATDEITVVYGYLGINVGGGGASIIEIQVFN